jgi:RND family efflux transporter MFP subunit
MSTQAEQTFVPGRLSIGIALIVLMTVSACHREAVEQVETTAVVPVTIETAKVGVLQELIAATGVVGAAPGAELVVVAPAPARIAELPHAEGDSVKAGDILVRFDIPSLGADVEANRAKVKQAMARVESTRANVTRLSSLLEQGVAAPRDVEDAKQQQAEAEGDVAQAQSAVGAAVALSNRAVVRAPFSGVIAQRFHNPGDLVEATSTDAVLKLIDPSRLQVVAAVASADLSKVVVGHAATIRQAGQDEETMAKVATKAPLVDAATGSGSVRLVFAKPPQLTAGLPVQVDIVGQEHSNVLIIPTAALVDDEGDLFVMVAGEDNKAHRHPVAVGLSTRTQVEITSGIKAGDRVIVRGQDGLPEGAAVSIESQ